jgi:hypothetical protein
MKRLEHLKKTLPVNLAIIEEFSSECKVSLLNYGKDAELNIWVNSELPCFMRNKLLIYSESEASYWNRGHAKNLAARATCFGTVLCGLDADNFLTKDFVKWVFDKYENNTVTVPREGGDIVADLSGRIVLSRENFEKIKGYDESHLEWGYSETDFISKCMKNSIMVKFIPSELVRGCYIPHSNHLRNCCLPKQ